MKIKKMRVIAIFTYTCLPHDDMDSDYIENTDEKLENVINSAIGISEAEIADVYDIEYIDE